jgi:type IV pilus assembly protein PilX
MNMRHALHSTSYHAMVRSQRGIVLFIALIVMVLLSLAGVALIKSIDTSTSVTGNIAFRQAALMQANQAIESAIGDIYAGDSRAPADVLTSIDLRTDQSTKCYVASFDPTNDSAKSGQPALPSGVPRVLWKNSTATSLDPHCKLTDNLDTLSSKNTVFYVVQRMCTADAVGADPNNAQCDMMTPKNSGAATTGDTNIIQNPYPLYRVTVRVDGPNNSLAFVQAMIRG